PSCPNRGPEPAAAGGPPAGSAPRSSLGCQLEELRLVRLPEEVPSEGVQHALHLAYVGLDGPELEIQEVRCERKVDIELTSGCDRWSVVGHEDVELVHPGHELLRPLRRHGGVIE